MKFIKAQLRKKIKNSYSYSLLVKNQKGVALLMAISLFALLVVISSEVSYETNIEFVSSSYEVQRLQAFYAARAGLELGLLRVKVYENLIHNFGDSLGQGKEMLSLIWNFPFVWPPPVDESLNASDKDQLKKAIGESWLKGGYQLQIQDIGSAGIDLHALVSSNKVLRDKIKNQLLSLYEQKITEDKDFADSNRGVKFEEILNNVIDWMDSDNVSRNSGGVESADYRELLKQDEKVKIEEFPPNRHFNSLSELRLVAGMTDGVYNFLSQRVNLFGSGGINPNVASLEVIRSIDPGISREAAEEVIKRREDEENGGKFKNEEEFFSFLEGQQNVRLETSKNERVPLYFDEPMVFKVSSIGQVGKTMVQLDVVTQNINTWVNNRLDLEESQKKAAGEEGKEEGETTNPGAPETGEENKKNQGPSKTTKEKAKLPKGRPPIIYWQRS